MSCRECLPAPRAFVAHRDLSTPLKMTRRESERTKKGIFLQGKAESYTATVTEVSVRLTGRYKVSRSTGSRPASRMSRTSS